MDTTNVINEDRLAAAHTLLTAANARVATTEGPAERAAGLTTQQGDRLELLNGHCADECADSANRSCR